MKAAAIVSGAPNTVLDRKDFLGDDLFIIGADRGALTLLEHGIVPHLAVGDFDSVDPEEFNQIKKSCQNILPLNPEKDETDTEIALNFALERGATEIFLYGGLGGRLDHTVANIRLLLRFAKRGARINLLESGNFLTILSPARYAFSPSKYKYLSFFAMEGDVAGLTLKGVKYPLDEAILKPEDTLCISNEGLGGQVSVSFSSGYLLFIQSSDL